MNPRTITEAERTIPFGDTTLRLTDRELRLGAVEYAWCYDSDAPAATRYATPIEVLTILCPEHAFQVSADGHAAMRAKAERLRELERGLT